MFQNHKLLLLHDQPFLLFVKFKTLTLLCYQLQRFSIQHRLTFLTVQLKLDVSPKNTIDRDCRSLSELYSGFRYFSRVPPRAVWIIRGSSRVPPYHLDRSIFHVPLPNLGHVKRMVAIGVFDQDYFIECV